MWPGSRNPSAGAAKEGDAREPDPDCPAGGRLRFVVRPTRVSAAPPGNRHAVLRRLPWERGHQAILRGSLQLLGTGAKEKGPANRRPFHLKVPRSSVLVTVIVVVVPVLVSVFIPVDIVHEDSDAAVGAAADSRAHGGGVAARADYRDWRHLRNEDQV